MTFLTTKGILTYATPQEKKVSDIIDTALNDKHRLMFSPRDDSYIILFLEVVGIKLRVCNLAVVIF